MSLGVDCPKPSLNPRLPDSSNTSNFSQESCCTVRKIQIIGSSKTCFHLTISSIASEVTQWVKVIATKPNEVSWIVKYMWSQLLQAVCPLNSTGTLSHVSIQSKAKYVNKAMERKGVQNECVCFFIHLQ